MRLSHNRARLKATRISVIFLLLAWGVLKEEYSQIADMAYAYGGFSLVRLFVSGTTAYLAFLALITRRRFWPWFFGLITLGVNPLSPLHLGRAVCLLLAVSLAISIHAFRVPFYLKERRIERILSAIVDPEVRSLAETLIEEIKHWDRGNIVAEPSKRDAVTIGVSINVFATLEPEEKLFKIRTRGVQDEWVSLPIQRTEDWEKVEHIVKISYERSMWEEGLMLAMES